MISSTQRLVLAVSAGFLMLGQNAFGQGGGDRGTVHYRLDPANRSHHELQVTVEFNEVKVPVLEVRMSRSSPGRYALHEFAKNVYSVAVKNGAGEPLLAERISPHRWNIVTNGSRKVVFSYTLFADRVDGTYSAIDASHLHLNGPATYAWAKGFEERRMRVEINLPDGWRVATQLEETRRGNVFEAANLQALMDAPIEASDFWMMAWPVAAPSRRPEKKQTVRLALHHQGTESEAELYAELVAAVVDEQLALYEDAPAFDHGTYTFLADYLPWASGDGMEHRNSTVLSSSSSLQERMVGLLGTVSHEFLHAWNIERIRPLSLEPFDFERANMAGELWFGEGFTSYYDSVILQRAGISHFDDYVDGISRRIGGFLLSPARQFRSPEQMSHQAPFVDAAAWIDRTNRNNNFISYYSYGALLGLALDLELRARFDVPLDQFMRAVWGTHGVTEEPYTHADLQRILGEVSSVEFGRQFFDRFVHGREAPDFPALLEPAGLLLVPSLPGEGWVGVVALSDSEEGFVIDGPTRVGTALYQAGLDRGDVVLSVRAEALDAVALDAVALNAVEFGTLVEASEPGAVLELAVLSRGEERTVQVVVEANPELEVHTFEQEGREVKEAVLAFRESWLGKKSDRVLAAEKECEEGGKRFDFALEFCPWHGTELVPVLGSGERLGKE